MKLVPIIILCAVLVASVHLDTSGSCLPGVLLGMALAQGAVLLVAAATLSNAKWIAPVKRPLLSLAHLLWLFPLLVNLAPYSWRAHETAWLRADLFIIRNVIGLFILAVVGTVFRKVSLANTPSVGKWAVGYILTFVVVKTMVAMDWTMSFDYPWISTMYPAIYMIECMYAGLALTGIICFALERRQAGSAAIAVYDATSLFFGFALFWGGLFYAQYLTIWYGNLPEEVHFFTLRFAAPGGKPFFILTIALLFVVPFVTLLFHKARHSTPVFFFLVHVVLMGLLVHRVFHILPHVNLQLGFLVISTAAMLGAVAFTVRLGLDET